MFAQRTRDWIFISFLAIHIPATLLVDSQALFFAAKFSPSLLRIPFIFAARDDPLLQNANNYPSFAWFQAFIILEVIFQLPTFFIGLRGLYRDSSSIYPLLALYGASSATTTYACLATVLTMPGIPQAHLFKLLASYVPFFLVPLAMAIDFGARLTTIARRDQKGKNKVA
ncbi:Ema19p [Sporobolomyces salmoneus]|uniref:Ema19p n=1 Tax=Sporobolomyces salmoneus TaxID=183962 RepID=UPI00316D5BAD